MPLLGDEEIAPRTWPRLRMVLRIVLGKTVTLMLATLALVLAVVSFVVLSGGTSLGLSHREIISIVPANFCVLMLLVAAVSVRVVRVLIERRRGSAGSRLQAQLVLLFSVVAVTPTIVVAIFATVFFQVGIQAWFNQRVSTALDESMQVARGYLTEHKNEIRTDAFAMADDMERAGPFITNNPANFGQFLTTQISLRGLTEAVVFEPTTGQVIASAGFMGGNPSAALPPPWAVNVARGGDVVVMGSKDGTTVSGLVQLDSTPPLMLLIQKPVDPAILAHMAHTEAAVDRLSSTRIASAQPADHLRRHLRHGGAAGAVGVDPVRAGLRQSDRAARRPPHPRGRAHPLGRSRRAAARKPAG